MRNLNLCIGRLSQKKTTRAKSIGKRLLCAKTKQWLSKFKPWRNWPVEGSFFSLQARQGWRWPIHRHNETLGRFQVVRVLRVRRLLGQLRGTVSTIISKGSFTRCDCDCDWHLISYGVITLSENNTDNDSNNENYNYGFHGNVQNCLQCSEILSVSFSLSVITPRRVLHHRWKLKKNLNWAAWSYPQSKKMELKILPADKKKQWSPFIATSEQSIQSHMCTVWTDFCC